MPKGIFCTFTTFGVSLSNKEKRHLEKNPREDPSEEDVVVMTTNSGLSLIWVHTLRGGIGFAGGNLSLNIGEFT